MGNIYFRKEAEEWDQAFPIGNGFLGAMVFGNVAKERIQVNEDSVWSGGFQIGLILMQEDILKNQRMFI